MSIKVVHTINAFTPTTGGTATCTYDLLGALNTCADMQAQIVVTKPRQPLMGHGEPWIIAVENDEKTTFGISSNLRVALNQTDADIYHTNGLWRYCNHVTAVVAKQKNKPFVITPHGMLYPQALAQSRYQKKLLRLAMFDKDIRDAACIHVTCEEEMRHVRALGFTNPIAIIANPVLMPRIAPQSHSDKVTFGYLGRLHQRKRVERLIDALAQLTIQERRQCELVIMGSGDPTYEVFLHERAKQLQLDNVRFIGFVEGIEKQRQLASLSALFVPSDFENFGMIISEALSCSIPVWASTGTPWKQLIDNGCGWWQKPTIENIVFTMRQILNMPPKNLDEMGKNGHLLVKEQFSAEAVAQQMKELYNWILNKQSKPSFVYDE